MTFRSELTLKYFCLLIIVAIAISGMIAARGLYADGSFFLLTILKNGGFIADEAARSYAQFLTQLPVVLSLKLGVTNLNFLIYAFNFGLIFLPLFFWFIAICLQLNTNLFWLFALAFAATYLNSGFFSIGEYNLAYSLSALCAAILFRDLLTTANLLVVATSAFVLTRCYEAMFFFGPLLFLLTSYHLIYYKGKKISTFLLLSLASILFIASFYIALKSILHPNSPGNLSNALTFSSLLHSVNFVYFVLMFLLCVLLLFIQNRKVQAAISIIGVVSSIYFLSNHNFWSLPNQHYGFRTTSGLLLFFIILMTGTIKFYKKLTAPLNFINSSFVSIVSFTLFASSSFIFIHHTFNYYSWAKEYEFLSVTNSKFIPIDEIGSEEFKRLNNKFNWPWTNPTLSILLRGNTESIILNQSDYGGWQPFDPKNISTDYLIGYYKVRNFY